MRIEANPKYRLSLFGWLWSLWIGLISWILHGEKLEEYEYWTPYRE
jgi:hypothetical protein